MRRKLLAALALAVAVVAGLTSAALGYFTVSTNATQLASASTLAGPGSANAATAGATSLTISASASAATPAPTGYAVYPHGSTSSPACTITGASGSCSVSGLTAGTTSSYDVYSTLANWVSTAYLQVSGTTTPAQPTAAAVAGTTNGYVAGANQSTTEIDVTLPATSKSSDSTHLTISDGTTTVTATVQAGTSGAGTVAFTGLDLSALHDGSLTIKAWSTSTAGSSSVLATSAVKDTVAPTVTVTAPTAGSTTTTLTPTFTGTAGTQAADSAHSADSTTATVKVYAGTAATGTPVQTLTATVGGTGAWSVAASIALTAGQQYTVVASQPDGATNVGTSSAVTFTAGPLPPVALKFINLSGLYPLATTGNVEMVNVNGSPVVNTTGATITVSVSGGTLGPVNVQIAAGQTVSTGFSVLLPLSGTLTASATVNGQTLTGHT